MKPVHTIKLNGILFGPVLMDSEPETLTFNRVTLFPFDPT
jgi:hypothetical protein